MNSKLTRIVAAATTGAVLAIGGATVAQAATGPSVASEQSQAQQLSQLAVKLQNAAAAQDLAGVRSAVDGLRTVLPQVKARSAEVAKADGLAADVQRALPVPGLPAVPITIVTGLIPGLLASLSAILNGLLGTLPVPIPVPTLPDLPIPDLPLP